MQKLGVLFVLVLSACAGSIPAGAPSERAFFLTEADAARLSVRELLRRYAAEADPAALDLSTRQCPAENARVDSLVTGLLDLASARERARDYALYWSKLLPVCGDSRVAAWFRGEIAHQHDDLTVQLLTTALLRTQDASNIRAVKDAAFDTMQHIDARGAILTLLVDELNLAGAERLDIMIASYRQTGGIPGNFVTDQAAQVWLQHIPNWRESLLAEVVAGPGKRGAPPLLLILARETHRSRSGSRLRNAWETALETLQTHPKSSADLKLMIPIAREVAQNGK